MTRGAIVRGLRRWRLTPDSHRFSTPDSDDGGIIDGRAQSFLPSGQAPRSACPHPGAAWSRAPGPSSIFVLAGQGPRRGRSPVERRTARHRSSPARFTFRTRSLHGHVVGGIGSCSSPLQRCYWAAPRRCPVGSSSGTAGNGVRRLPATSKPWMQIRPCAPHSGPPRCGNNGLHRWWSSHRPGPGASRAFGPGQD